MTKRSKPLIPDDAFGDVDPSVGQRRDVVGAGDMGIGVFVINRNARRLMVDAVTLAEAGSYATALAIGVLAQEESGKAQVVTFLGANANQSPLKRLWKMFESHRPKGELPVSAYEMAFSSRHPARSMPISPADYVEALDRWKERALYVESTHAPTRWSVPAAIFERRGCLLMLNAILQTMRVTHMTGHRASTLLPLSDWAQGSEGHAACVAIEAWGRTRKALALHERDEAEHKTWYETLKHRLDVLATDIDGWPMGTGNAGEASS